jgi:hyaluronate lyase
VAAGGIPLAAGLVNPNPVAAADDFAAIVAAYRELQVGRGQSSAKRTVALQRLDQIAGEYEATMNTAAGSTQLWADLPKGPGSDYFPTMYARLRAIAVDWATPGSVLSQKAGMDARIIAALEILYATEYNENTSEIGNWYSYEIGVPYWVLHILAALGDKLSTEDRARFLRPVLRFNADPNRRTNTPSLAETGANRADKSLIAVVAGAMVGDAARVAAGMDAITDVVGGGAASVVARVTHGDGFHPDGAFIQHDVVPYPGHYGLVLLAAVASLMYVTKSATRQLAADVQQKTITTVSDVYAPFVAQGAMLETVRGRMLSRQSETGHDAGHILISAVVLLALQSGSTDLTSLVRKWIAEGTWAPYLDVPDVHRFAPFNDPVGVPGVEFAEQLLAGSSAQAAAAVPVHRTFPQEDRMVHTTARWTASLGVGSTRICRYESINGQNLHGWYVGDGCLYVFLPNQQGHYSDAYWPTVDATLLPGTTTKASTPPALGSTPLSSKAFAGGIAFDSGHGAQGLDFVSQDGMLTAHKSWFFTPDGVICLGAGITDSSGAVVRTTIENRSTNAPLLVDGRSYSSDGSWSVSNPQWLDLPGVAAYFLLEKGKVALKRESRTGTWRDVDTGANTKGSTDPYTRHYQSIVLDHGANPVGAHYAYAVVPVPSVVSLATARLTRVLANTADAQAVRTIDGLELGVFFAAGTAGSLTTSAAAVVGWKNGTLAVSDPSQLGSTVRVTVRSSARKVVHADPAVTVVSTRPLVVDVAVAGSQGATHRLSVR